MKEKAFWIIVILFAIGTIINAIASKEYRQVIIAKEGNGLSIHQFWFDEDSANLIVSIPRSVLDIKATKKHPKEVLLKYQLVQDDHIDTITITKQMRFAWNSESLSFKTDNDQIKFQPGANMIKLDILKVAKVIENTNIEFRIPPEIPGILVSPPGVIHKVIWYFNFRMVWGLGLLIWGIIL